jgi:hypothetical protein
MELQTTLACMLEEIDALFLKKHAACIGEHWPIPQSKGYGYEAIVLQKNGLALAKSDPSVATVTHWRDLNTESQLRLAGLVVAFDRRLTEVEKRLRERGALLVEELELFIRRQTDPDAR